MLYANLKTNKNGEVEVSNLLPGKYYIKETNAKDGYVISEDLVEINVEFNQNVIVTINNKFKEKTEVKIEQKKETNVVFGGRLGEYKYYDMDAVIASALSVSRQELG